MQYKLDRKKDGLSPIWKSAIKKLHNFEKIKKISLRAGFDGNQKTDLTQNKDIFPIKKYIYFAKTYVVYYLYKYYDYFSLIAVFYKEL